MAWTVNVDEVLNGGSFLIVRVTLSNGQKTIKPDEYHVDNIGELKVRINADIDKLTQVETDFQKIVPGPFDPTIAVVQAPDLG